MQPLFFIRIVAAAFVLVGLWLAYATVEHIATQRALRAEGVRAEARIVGAQRSRAVKLFGSRRAHDHHLTVAWTDTSGAQRSLRRKVPSYVYYRFARSEGTVIVPTDTILYVPANPAIKPVMGFDDPGLPGGPLIGAAVSISTGLFIAWFAWTPPHRRRGIVAILAGQ